MSPHKVKVPKAKLLKACISMRAMGIAEEHVKPVLDNLANLYDNNWALIEDENYRVLVDAIFEQQEVKGIKSKAGEAESMDDESEESGLSLIRHCLRQQKDNALTPLVDSTESSCGTLLRSSLEMPQLQWRKNMVGSSQQFEGHELVESEPLSPSEGVNDKSPRTHAILLEKEPPQPCLMDKREGPDSSFPHTQLPDKGKKPINSTTDQRENRINYEKEMHIEGLKVPKIEPDNVISPRAGALHSYQNATSITRKHKSFTKDSLQLEVPLAVIHPTSPSLLSEGGPSNGHQSCTKEDDHKVQESNYVDVADKDACGDDPANDVPDSSQFDIASSQNEEVKISLIRNNSQQSGFHIPNLVAVSKALEDKYRVRYGITEPSFSVMKLMQEFCEYFIAMGADSTDDEKLKTMEISSPLEMSKETAAKDVSGRGGDHVGELCILSSFSNGSVKIQNLVEMGPQIQRPIQINGFDVLQRASTSNEVNENCYVERNENLVVLGASESLNSGGIVANQKPCSSVDIVKSHQYLDDITKGEEMVKISLVNETSSQLPPKFFYIPRNIVFQKAFVNFALARISDEDCCTHCYGDCTSVDIPCACARETGGEFAYQQGGLVKDKFLEECMNRDPQNHRLFYCKNCPLERSRNDSTSDPCKGHLVRKFIKECWCKCGCSKKCGNRVVQRGITANLQVFWTQGEKGWGLRTLEDLPKGAFVCEYVGEIVTNTELYERNLLSTGKERHTYPVLLDADWGSERVLKDEEALCLDATFYGNVARFINHRCFDANLVEIPVEVETPDHHYYHLAFFTTRKVDAFEELTWDYGIDFDDHNHPVKAFKCCCGSKGCRDTRNSKRHGVKRRKTETRAQAT